MKTKIPNIKYIGSSNCNITCDMCKDDIRVNDPYYEVEGDEQYHNLCDLCGYLMFSLHCIVVTHAVVCDYPSLIKSDGSGISDIIEELSNLKDRCSNMYDDMSKSHSDYIRCKSLSERVLKLQNVILQLSRISVKKIADICLIRCLRDYDIFNDYLDIVSYEKFMNNTSKVSDEAKMLISEYVTSEILTLVGDILARLEC